MIGFVAYPSSEYGPGHGDCRVPAPTGNPLGDLADRHGCPHHDHHDYHHGPDEANHPAPTVERAWRSRVALVVALVQQRAGGLRSQ